MSLLLAQSFHRLDEIDTTTCRRDAPSAVRIPISRCRWVTATDIIAEIPAPLH